MGNKYSDVIQTVPMILSAIDNYCRSLKVSFHYNLEIYKLLEPSYGFNSKEEPFITILVFKMYLVSLFHDSWFPV